MIAVMHEQATVLLRYVLLATVLVALLPATRPVAADSDPEAAIRQVLEDQSAAWNRGDLEGFMAGYWNSPDLVFTSGGQVRRGWKITLENYRERYGTAPETMGHLTFSELEIHPLSPDVAWVLGRWQLVMGSGNPGGVFTLVMRRIDGNWLVVHDHTSSDPS